MLKIYTYGAIDIGSNAIRLIITDVYQMPQKVQYKKITLIRVPIRLGEDVFTRGFIGETKQARFIEALTGFSFLLKAYGVKIFRACATSAMREAQNSDEVIAQIHKETGIQIDIISGDEEAYLIQSGGVAELMHDNRTYLYVDVGGGSTEIILYSNNQRIAAKSFPIGTVRMISKATSPLTETEMKDWLTDTLKNYSNPVIIGSGGNINKFQKLIENKEGKPMKIKKLKDIREQLNYMSMEERLADISLSPHRADVIVPALDIFISIMKTVKAKELIVPKIGLGDGIIRHLHREYVNVV
jgi:exopolyphosphatase/guanosine-5'-triphosphate,3'-diphosphate pyrophosphatase